MSRKCPRDNSTMREKSMDDKLAARRDDRLSKITIDECTECRGIFFDAHEAEASIGAEESLLSLDDTAYLEMPCRACHKTSSPKATACEHCKEPIGLVCPGCAKRMVLVVMLGVEIDVCESCKSMWFDAGELKKIQRRYRLKVAHKAEKEGQSTTSTPPKDTTPKDTTASEAEDTTHSKAEDTTQMKTCEMCKTSIPVSNAYKTKNGYFCRKCFPNKEGATWYEATGGDPQESNVGSNLITAWLTMEIVDAVFDLFSSKSD